MFVAAIATLIGIVVGAKSAKIQKWFEDRKNGRTYVGVNTLDDNEPVESHSTGAIDFKFDD